MLLVVETVAASMVEVARYRKDFEMCDGERETSAECRSETESVTA
jgi:hypothetical protein